MVGTHIPVFGWKSEDNLWELIFSLYFVDSGLGIKPRSSAFVYWAFLPAQTNFTTLCSQSSLQCIPNWPPSHRGLPVSASWELGLKVCATKAWLQGNILKNYLLSNFGLRGDSITVHIRNTKRPIDVYLCEVEQNHQMIRHLME